MARKAKLTDKHRSILNAAVRFKAVVPGGIHGTFNQIYNLSDWGLLEPLGLSQYKITEKGLKALEIGEFEK